MTEMTPDQLENFLETALKRHLHSPLADEAGVHRVLKRLAGPLPPQKREWWRLPSVLLSWDLAPAWPRMAALACCAALGFVIGIAGLDRPFDRLSSSFPVSHPALSPLVSE